MNICFLSTFIASLVLAAHAHAVTVFTANITHDQEPAPSGTTPLTTSTGAPRPLSFGTAEFILNDAETELSMTATIFNIDVTGLQTPADPNDDLANAHIHVGAALGVNAPVRWGFFGAPDNDMSPDNLIVIPFGAGVGGTFTSVWNLSEGNAGTTLTVNLPEIKEGLSYINFHTIQFAGGEILGQITPLPDAGATAFFLCVGMAGLEYVRRNS